LRLSRDECLARLAGHGVGRISITTGRGPAIIPVNYSVVEGAIVFRTAPGSAPASAAGTEVAFEVDHIDESLSQGWSVLVVGRAGQVTDAAEMRRLAEAAHSKPWAGGEREMWIRIVPVNVTGRRIQVR
jgi:nitroimidazol reductase NimA-like FMN-containing flavoprotein (pyridoxamine 5'-phosphate oxidase superfamily)